MIKKWKQRELKVVVSVGKADEYGVETQSEGDGEKRCKWVACCETHGNFIGEPTKQRAILTARATWNFCDVCVDRFYSKKRHDEEDRKLALENSFNHLPTT